LWGEQPAQVALHAYSFLNPLIASLYTGERAGECLHFVTDPFEEPQAKQLAPRARLPRPALAVSRCIRTRACTVGLT
jgi:hypothetical protein